MDTSPCDGPMRRKSTREMYGAQLPYPARARSMQRVRALVSGRTNRHLEDGSRSVRWNNKNALITGANGFIGSHLAKTLLSLGANVSAILHQPIRRGQSRLLLWEIASNVQGYIGDVADADFVQSTLGQAKPQWIFHLAAQSIVGKGQRSAQATIDTNVRGTINILALSKSLGDLEGIIVASSDKVYGDSEHLPYEEHMPLKGGSVYATS